MRDDLVFRFIEVQALILSPICPHIGEQIWQIIGKDGLIVNAKWPDAGPVDENITKAADFIKVSISKFRERLNNHLNPKKKTTTVSILLVIIMSVI